MSLNLTPGRGVRRSAQRSDQRMGQRVQIRTAANRYELDETKKPSGTTYEWKRDTVFGKEDTENMVNCEMNGWTPVPADRHPELSGSRATADQAIRRGGLMLMERPSDITDESRQMERDNATQQVSQQLQRLNLKGHRENPKGIKRKFEAIPDEVDIEE